MWTLMGGWINFCDVKKLNSKYQYFKSKNIPDGANLNKHKISTKTKSKQSASCFIKTIAQTLAELKADPYSEPCQTSKMELFALLVRSC